MQKWFFIANKKVLFIMGLLMNVDPFFFNFFFLIFMLIFLFLFINNIFFFKIFSENEMKFLDNIFFFFMVTNIFGLSAFYMSISLWPFIMIFCSFFFWFQSILSLLKISFIYFFKHFSQENLMILMTCFMVYIEILSIFIRFITLGFRLLANILGGHLMMELAAQNTKSILTMIFLFSYEFFVSIIQSVIYTILVFFYTIESMEKY